MDGNGETTISYMKMLESSNSNNHLQTKCFSFQEFTEAEIY